MKAVKTAQDRIDTRNRYFFGLGTVVIIRRKYA